MTDPFLYTDLYNNSRLYELVIEKLLLNPNKEISKEDISKSLAKNAISTAISNHYVDKIAEEQSKITSTSTENEIKEIENNVKDLTNKLNAELNTIEAGDLNVDTYKNKYKLTDNDINGITNATDSISSNMKELSNSGINEAEVKKLLYRSQGSVLYYYNDRGEEGKDNECKRRLPIFFTRAQESFSITQSNSWIDLGDTISAKFTQGVVDAKNNMHEAAQVTDQIIGFISNLTNNDTMKRISESVRKWAAKYQAYSVLFNASNSFKKYTGTDINIPNLSLTGYIIDDKGEGTVIPYIRFLTSSLVGQVIPGEYNPSQFTEGTILAPIANVLNTIIKDTAKMGTYIPPKGYVNPNGSDDLTKALKGTVSLQYMPGVFIDNLLVAEVSYTIPNMRVATNSNIVSSNIVAPFMALINIQLIPASKIFSDSIYRMLNDGNDIGNKINAKTSMSINSYQNIKF